MALAAALLNAASPKGTTSPEVITIRSSVWWPFPAKKSSSSSTFSTPPVTDRLAWAPAS